MYDRSLYMLILSPKVVGADASPTRPLSQDDTSPSRARTSRVSPGLSPSSSCLPAALQLGHKLAQVLQPPRVP